jgi:hypothetical protein
VKFLWCVVEYTLLNLVATTGTLETPLHNDNRNWYKPFEPHSHAALERSERNFPSCDYEEKREKSGSLYLMIVQFQILPQF